MEIYENENEQRDAIKNFFAENGKALVVGIVLGIGALVGWRYWNHGQLESVRQSSLAYDNAISALKSGNAQAVNGVEKFVAQNSNTYGALASLSIAQKYVEQHDLTKANAQLMQGVNDAKDDNLKSLINLRLARVEIQQKQADAALKTLDSVKGEGWAAIVADLRGEALLSKGDKQGARDAWTKGVASDASPALRETIQMKINNLSS